MTAGSLPGMDMVMVLGILGWEMMFWAGKFIDN